MGHYAFLDANNIVTEVIVGKDEGEEGIDWEVRYAEIRGQPCKRTSYNTQGGQHPTGHRLGRTMQALVTPTIQYGTLLYRNNLLQVGY